MTWTAAAEFLTALAQGGGGRLELAIAYARTVLAETEEGAIALTVLDGGPDAVTRALELAQRRLAQAAAVATGLAGKKKESA